jgi:tetratricopeptide (TPR) repeat protein
METMSDQKYLLATILANKGLHQEALQLLEQLLISEVRPEYFLLKGKILVHLERLQDARDSFNKIGVSDPLYDDAQNAIRRLDESENNKYGIFYSMKDFFRGHADLLRNAGMIISALLILSLAVWIVRMNTILRHLSENTKVFSEEITGKINHLDIEMSKTAFIGPKLDSLSFLSGQIGIKILKMDTTLMRLNKTSTELGTCINHLNNKVDSLVVSDLKKPSD